MARYLSTRPTSDWQTRRGDGVVTNAYFFLVSWRCRRGVRAAFGVRSEALFNALSEGGTGRQCPEAIDRTYGGVGA